jgi:hypothetical protein
VDKDHHQGRGNRGKRENHMTPINLEKWPRKAIFELYRDFDYPQINVCTEIDVTAALQFLRKQNISKFKTILWAICHVSNSIDEFKYRELAGENLSKIRPKPSCRCPFRCITDWPTAITWGCISIGSSKFSMRRQNYSIRNKVKKSVV